MNMYARSEYADGPRKRDRAAVETAPVSETQVTAEVRGDLDAARRALQRERLLSQESFAVQTFFTHGGHELVSTYGMARVMNAFERLDQETHPDLLRVVRALEPHKENRRTLFDKMANNAKTLEEERTARRNELHAQPDRQERFERRTQWIDRSYVLATELTAQAASTEDQSRFANPQNARLLRESVERLAEALRTDPTLKSRLVEDVNLLEAMNRLGEEHLDARETRQDIAARALEKTNRAIQDIHQYEEGEFAKTMKPVRERLRDLSVDATDNPKQRAILAAIEKATTTELNRAREALQLEIARKITPLLELRQAALGLHGA